MQRRFEVGVGGNGVLFIVAALIHTFVAHAICLTCSFLCVCCSLDHAYSPYADCLLHFLSFVGDHCVINNEAGLAPSNLLSTLQYHFLTLVRVFEKPLLGLLSTVYLPLRSHCQLSSSPVYLGKQFSCPQIMDSSMMGGMGGMGGMDMGSDGYFLPYNRMLAHVYWYIIAAIIFVAFCLRGLQSLDKWYR